LRYIEGKDIIKNINSLKLQNVAYYVSLNFIAKNSNFSEINRSTIKGIKSLMEETLRCAEYNLPSWGHSAEDIELKHL
jgi:hypothetical protein